MSMMSTKKTESGKEEKVPALMAVEKQIEEWKKLYCGLNLDKKHMIKSIGNPEIVKRDMLKRN